MELRIFVSCHKPSYVPDCELFEQVQVGTEIASEIFPNMHHDNEGDNISKKNKTYCELTAQYWAWKNVKADYYGFFHYRRYFSFEKSYIVDKNGQIEDNYPKPYEVVPDIKSDLSKFNYNADKIKKLVGQYDVVSIIRERYEVNAYEQFLNFHSNNSKKDVDILLKILKQMYPKFARAADLYMNSKELYFMNMFIMKKEYFENYMKWIFSILEEFEKNVDHTEYSESELRAPAYLAERLFGIYYTYIKKNTTAKCCELPYVVFENTDPYQTVHPVFKDEVPIVLSSNQKFVPYLAVMLQSIVQCSTNKHNYDILILHKDIDNESQKKLIDIAKEHINIKIRFYNCKYFIENISFEVHHHFSEETFYRYFILDIMKDYSKVLYLDVDMVVMQDVASLYEENIKGYFLAAVKDVDVIGTYKSDETYQKYLDLVLRLNSPLEYFQAGVLLLNLDEIRKSISTQYMIDLTLAGSWRMVDQDVLNILCHGKVRFISQKWNVLMNWKFDGKSRMDVIKCTPYELYCEYQAARKNPCIVHYAGGWKPWNTPECDFSEYFWRYAKETSFYEIILKEMLGSGYTQNPIQPFNGNVDYQGIKSKDMEVPIYTDGVLVKAINKLNRKFPIGSRKRENLKKVAKFFVRG